MLQKIPYTVSSSLIDEVKLHLPSADTKISLNEPTGNFFYDPWSIKPEYKGTIWETLLNTLPISYGEARIMVLTHGTTYMSHTDIDDRFHLNLKGQYSYLIDLDSDQMFPTVLDCQWYEMDTGRRHVAANFGSHERVQLVVRKLLHNGNLTQYKQVTIKPICVNPRFEFDDIVSPWLNKANKKEKMSDFKILDDGVSFNLNISAIEELEFIPTNKFKVIIK